MADKWIVDWQGEPRLQRYLDGCGQDQSLALATYEWNLRLGMHLMRDIAHLEIALRNSYDRAMQEAWGSNGHWITNTTCPFHLPISRTVIPGDAGVKTSNDANYQNPKKVNKAIKKLTRELNGPPSPGKVIAELPFGVWASLTTKLFHEAIWMPAIHKAFPKGTAREEVHKLVDPIWTVRNRVAHHEPIFFVRQTNPRHPLRVHQSIVDLLQMIGPKVGELVADTSGVEEAYYGRPRVG